MKKVLRNGFVMVMAALFVSVFSINTSKAQGSVSLQVFYDELQPYGTWMQHGSHGYVWMPRVDRGFTPYATNGYWINTEYGNTWVSDYSWGWAPFHYGRWFHDDFYGWMWVPDTEWAPAWVAWRSGGGYYGWAPLMPGFGINVSFSYYNRLPNHYWNFVPYRYVTYRTVYNHCVPRPHVINIINNTTIITHNYTDNRRRTYFTGPTRSEMERTGRTRVDVYKVSDSGRPGRTQIDRGTASFYKPEVNSSRETRASAMPSRYLRADQDGNREMVESRRERSIESEQKLDNTQRSLERSNRSMELEKNPSLERQSMDRRDRTEAVERFDREREDMNRDQQNYNQRREQLERQSNPRSSFRSDQNMRQQPDNNLKSPQQQSQKLEQMQRQSNPRSMERQDQNFRQPSNELRRSSDPSQRTQQMERQNPGRSEQPSQNVQRQRSNEVPSMNRNSTQQRQPQVQRTSPQQRSNQPARSGGSERGSSLRRN